MAEENKDINIIANITDTVNTDDEVDKAPAKRGRPKSNKPPKEKKPVGRPKVKADKPKTKRVVAPSFALWQQAKKDSGITGKFKKGSDEYNKVSTIYNNLKCANSTMNDQKE